MVSTQMLAPLALLATVPVTAFFLYSGESFVLAAFLNLALIAGSLWLLFGGGEDPEAAQTEL